jgi:hypothetical protein
LQWVISLQKKRPNVEKKGVAGAKSLCHRGLALSLKVAQSLCNRSAKLILSKVAFIPALTVPHLALPKLL